MIRVKALALQGAGHIEAAKTLLHRVIDTPDGYAVEVAFATERLGDLAAIEGDHALAEVLYRHVLSQWPTLNGTTGTMVISLAECLIERAAHDEALELLNRFIARPRMMVDSELFRWHLALTEVTKALGEDQTVRRPTPHSNSPGADPNCHGIPTWEWSGPTPKPSDGPAFRS